jgi:hypothetical protein
LIIEGKDKKKNEKAEGLQGIGEIVKDEYELKVEC